MPLRDSQGYTVVPQPPRPEVEPGSAIPFVPGEAPGFKKLLPVPHVIQSKTQWCWAACAEMVLAYYGTQVAGQCEIAGWLHDLEGCCASADGEECNRSCKADDVGSVYDHWGVSWDLRQEAVEFADLLAELGAERPVQVCFSWSGGRGGHVALVRGYGVGRGGTYFFVNDPLGGHYGRGQVHYSDLVAAYGAGRWTLTWVNLEK